MGKLSIYKYSHSGNEATSYQVFNNLDPSLLSPLKMEFSSPVLSGLSRLARVHLLPKKPEIGVLCLFSLPCDLGKQLPAAFDNPEIADPSARVRYTLNRACRNGELQFVNGRLETKTRDLDLFFNELKRRDMLSVIDSGKPGSILFIPVSDKLGYLSDHNSDNSVIVNSHFFLLDLTDLESIYDQMGEPYGLLMVKNSIVLPPLYPRAAFFLENDGTSRIERVGIKDTGIIIDKILYRHGRNCRVFIRPEHSHSPEERTVSLAVAGNRIVGLSGKGRLEIPEAGFVIHISGKNFPGDLRVSYLPFKGSFGIQVGPPLVSNGKVMDAFQEPFFNGKGVPFPPTVYPPGWRTGRAARMGIGTSRNGDLSVIWSEGSKPATYRPGLDSRGFTLAEFAEAGEANDMTNFVNLDGGGSAQAIANGKRALSLADRIETGGEFERPVPMGLRGSFY